jgi:O-antigen ligase
MTVVEPGAAAGPAERVLQGAAPATDGDARRTAEHLAVLAMVALAVLPAAHAGGGRDAGSLAVLALVTAAALVLTAPWRRLASPAWLLAPLLACAALLVLPATGVGRWGAVAAVTYGVMAAAVPVMASYARTPGRRAAVATLVCAGGVAQFAWALVPWWGGADPSAAMVGTYYWHNQYAAALLAPALLGLALVLARHRPWRAAGWVSAPLAVAGVVFSTSRSSLGLLVVGWLAVVAVAVVRSRQRRACIRRAVAVSALALVVTLALPGPPLFAHWISPLHGAAQRAAVGETLSANGGFRTEFWRESLGSALAHPLTGVGYGRLAREASLHAQPGWAVSSLAHSGPLQAFADGGLLLVLPLMAALGAVLVGLARALRTPGVADPAAPGAEASADRLLVRATAVTAAVLGLHALVDTDWTYPALAVQLAVVVGVALAATVGRSPSDPPASGRPTGRIRLAAAAGTALLAAALVVGGVAAWGQTFHILDPRADGKVQT